MMYKRDYYDRFDMIEEYSKLVKRSKEEIAESTEIFNEMNEKIEQLIKEIARIQLEIEELKND
jgi:methyl-accepting chemotaxis protein